MNRAFGYKILMLLCLTAVAATLTTLPATPVPTATAAIGPKIEGTNDTGFGGIITGVVPCICKTLGVLIKITGPFGGNFIYSFSKPPKIKVGSFFLVGGPVLGGAGGSGECGTDIDDGSCEDEEDGKVITILGGIL